MICNLCKNSSKFQLVYRKDGFNIVKCLNCGLIFRENLPDGKGVKNIYADDYFIRPIDDTKHQGYLNYLKDESFLRLNFQKRLEQIQQIKNGKNLLDIGCAAGFFLDEAKKRGWDTKGVEISNSMAEYGKSKFDLDIYNGTFQEYQTNQKFDVVTMWDYLEHSIDPMADISKAYTLLKENGLLVITTGNIDSLAAKLWGINWHLLTPHHHLFYFSKNTIKQLLENNGFKISRLSNSGNYYSLKYLLHKLIPYLHFSFLTNLTERINNSFLGEWLIYINLFDIMTIYATKH